MHFTKARCSRHAQQFFEDFGTNTFPSVFCSDIQLENLSSHKVYCPKSHGYRTVLSYDDLSITNVIGQATYRIGGSESYLIVSPMA